jgi:hypothetical protein
MCFVLQENTDMTLGFRSAALILMLALAGCNTVPEGQPDASAKSMDRNSIRDAAKDYCIRRVVKENNLSLDQATTGCGCYANRTVSQMSRQDVVDFREKGYFNEGTSKRALLALDLCNVPKPY